MRSKYDLKYCETMFNVYIRANKARKQHMFMGKYSVLFSEHADMTICMVFFSPFVKGEFDDRHAHLMTSGVAVCNPVDTYTYETGCKEAFRKAMNDFASHHTKTEHAENTIKYMWERFVEWKQAK